MPSCGDGVGVSVCKFTKNQGFTTPVEQKNQPHPEASINRSARASH